MVPPTKLHSVDNQYVEEERAETGENCACIPILAGRCYRGRCSRYPCQSIVDVPLGDNQGLTVRVSLF